MKSFSFSKSVVGRFDIFLFVFLLLSISHPKWLYVEGRGIVAESLPKPREGELSTISSNTKTFFEAHLHHQQHNHHHNNHHQPTQLLLSSTTSTEPPYWDHRNYHHLPYWQFYASNGEGGDDYAADSNIKTSSSNEKTMSRSSHWNSSKIISSSGTMGTNSLALMGISNESMYLETSAPTALTNLSEANATEGYEIEEETFEAEIPWWRQMIWSMLFGAMVVVACAGNVTVIWIVLAHKKMRTVTNYLLVNLSIADAMSSTLNVIPNYSYMLTTHWPFGALYCKIVQFVSLLSICASVFSLMAIAFDRYLAIMNPLKPRMGKRLTLGIVAGIWIGGTILSMPGLLFFQTYEKFYENGESQVFCYAEWPDGPQNESYQENLYNVFFMIFTYFLPIAVMGYTYTRVGIELWGSKSIGECTQRQLDNIKSKRRVVKMMIVVVAIFAFCWLPFHMYFIWVSLWPIVTKYSFVQEVYLGIYWLAMSNSMYNPIIYCWMNNRFRRGFQQVFRWCPFVHYVEVETTAGYMMHTQRERETTRYSVTGSPELQLTRVSRNGSGSVHIHLHVMNNESGRSPSNRSMSTNSSNMPVSGSGNQGYHHHQHHHHNGNVGRHHHHQSQSSGGGGGGSGGSNIHQHHAQCHEFQKNLGSTTSSRGNTMV